MTRENFIKLNPRVVANPIDSDLTNRLLCRLEVKRLDLALRGIQPKGLPRGENRATQA